MISSILKNITHIRSSLLGLAAMLVTAGAALSAFVDGDAATTADWQAVAIAATSFISSLWLIFGSKD